MRSAYRVLAMLIAVLVAVQAAAVALAMFGLFRWIDEGGTLDKSAFEGNEQLFGEEVGFMIHGMVGMMLIPLLALLLLIVSFFAKIPGGAKWAGLVLLTVVVQVALGLFAFEIPGLGVLHGLNALMLFALAVMAAMRSKTTTVEPSPYGAQQKTHV
jgi:hypothetical protein